MRTHGLNHLSDTELLRDLRSLLARERGITAEVLAHLAEIDARKLYVPAGYPSMFEYCVRELHLSEQAAMKRIRAARAGRKFPAIFEGIIEGRLHLSAVVLLAPYLTSGNAADLLAAAAFHTKAEIEELLARRFPKPDLPTRIEAIAPPSGLTPVMEQLSPGTVGTVAIADPDVPAKAALERHNLPEASALELSPGTVETCRPSRLRPLSAESFAIQFTIGKATREKLQHVQALLSHELPSGDIARVFDQALEALAEKLEKRKFAATCKPRARACRSASNPRHIPAHVKRAVWERDQGCCTFVSPTGHCCRARKFLEFDHVEPVARGGRATVAGIRLRCRAHNQFEAERAFGAGFMNGKLEQAPRTAAEARAIAPETEAHARAPGTETQAQAASPEAWAAAESRARDLKSCQREFGFRSEEIRRALDLCGTTPEATLEEQVRAALKSLSPRARVHRPVEPSMQTCA